MSASSTVTSTSGRVARVRWTKLLPMKPAPPVTRTFMRARVSAGRRSGPPRSGPGPGGAVRLHHHEGHHPRRRLGHAAAPHHPGHLQAAHADLRQADGLLPALDADDGRHPRGARHHHAPGRRPVRAAARRRPAVGHRDHLRRAAQPRRPRPGLRHRRRLHRRRRRGPGARRQHLLRHRPRHGPARAHRRARRPHLRPPRQRAHRLRRRRVRRRRHGPLDRGEARAPAVATTPCPACTSTTTTSSRSPATSRPAPAASSRSPPSTTPTCSAATSP